MRKFLPLFLLLFLPLLLLAQTPVVVPNNIYFADIHLKISEGGQREIQKKVDALHRSPAYFKIKVDLADAYFPLIERTFKEEGVPDDFKYLALQESGLIGDAVSTSNAVGYWQFKKEAATDFNLRVDNIVDERRHIVEASRGAAKYFKRSNNYYNNWFNALLSYYHGYTGAKAHTKESDKGSKKMNITEKTDPYLLTFLAHKVAYDNFIGKSPQPAISLREMRATPGQSLADIALATQIDYAELEKYNKWLLGGAIPSDKDYYVMIPVRNGTEDRGLLASKENASPVKVKTTQAAATLTKQNGLNVLIARPGDTKDKLALQAGISTRRFLKYNDLHNFDAIVAGSAYYIEPKHNSAEQEYHVVQPGETMQQISQHYGIKLKYLLFKNRMARSEAPVPGRVLWLKKRRPNSTPIEVRDLNQPQPKATPALAQESKVISANESREKAPKQNIFTRFINSLKKGRPEPIEEEIIDEEEEVIVTTEEKTEAEQTKSVITKQQPEKQQQETTAKPTEAKVEEPKANNAALYPGAQKTAPATQQAAAVGKKEEKEELVSTFEMTEEEVEVEVEELIVEERTTAQPTNKNTASTTTTATQPAQQKPTKHTVKQGETLYSISRLYAVSVNDISKWNQLGEEPLKVGQELLIAEPLTTPEEKETETTPVAPKAGKATHHTVAKGETLYQISREYEVSLEDLRNWNNLADNGISVGQQLRVAAPAGSQPVDTGSTTEKPAETKPATSGTGQSAYHTVETGESMYQISRKYGVTIKDIMDWNNKSDFSVSVGEKLLIRKK